VEDARRYQGTVKWFNASKGYGLHPMARRSQGWSSSTSRRSSHRATRSLDEDRPWNSSVEDGTKGPQAVNVVPVRA